jgi:glycerol-3-phosphate dehydrogenase
MDWYGPEAADVVHFCAESGLVDRLAPGLPLMSGEIAYAATHADALHLSDAILRRTPLGCSGHPGRDALVRAADVMGAVVGWSDSEKADQIAEVEGGTSVPLDGHQRPTRTSCTVLPPSTIDTCTAPGTS